MKDKRVKVSHKQLIDEDRRDKRKEKESDEPTCRCHQNPFIGALGISCLYEIVLLLSLEIHSSENYLSSELLK